MSIEKKYLVVVCGPTASGKTSLGIKLAQAYNTCIISADSRQFYREMNIGTAKPTAAEQQEAVHYFVNNISIFDHYTVGDYERQVIDFLNHQFQQHQVVIMVGGSGLFINAVCHGLDEFPDILPEIKQQVNDLFNLHGIGALQEQLAILDPNYYQIVDKSNPRRLMRALEVCLTANQPYSHFLNKSKKERGFEVIKIGIHWDRPKLNDRIAQRIALMEADGLLQEVQSLYAHKHLSSLNTIGYAELFEFLDNQVTYEKAIENLNTNTRRYAKRQMTWFRKDTSIQWFTSKEVAEVISCLHQQINPSATFAVG